MNQEELIRIIEAEIRLGLSPAQPSPVPAPQEAPAQATGEPAGPAPAHSNAARPSRGARPAGAVEAAPAGRGDTQALLQRIKASTSARVGIGRAGPRLRTDTLLTFRADHAAARDAVLKEVDPGLLEQMGLFSVQSRCRTLDEYLTRPDLGRQLSEESAQILKERCKARPTVQVFAGSGLSSTAIEANLKDILPAILEGLQQQGIGTGTPFYARLARVGLEDAVSELLDAEVVCLLVGERPGLMSAESMSAYIAYRATVGMPEARRTVVSNIHKDGIPAVEAGAYIADVIGHILKAKASGVDLKR